MAEPQAGPWPDVTAIWSAQPARELQVLHSRMPDPDPEPEPEAGL